MNAIKRIFILLLLLYPYLTKTIITPFNPTNTIIAIDLDEVVIKERENSLTSWFSKPSRWGFALALSRAKKKYGISDAYPLIDSVVQKHPKYAKLAHRLKKRLIQAKPIHGTQALITHLIQQGYTIIPASNMTTSVYKALLTNNHLPIVFKQKPYFIKTKKCNKKSNGRYYAKPTAAYYKNLKNYIDRKFSQQFTQIIFIDDKNENVRAARKEGIFGIHFKNPAQLRQALAQLGIKQVT